MRDITPATPSFSGCSHLDMAGDSAIEVQGDHRWCSICSASWIDKDIVVVNDERIIHIECSTGPT